MTIKRVYPGNDIFPIKRNCCYTAQGRLPCSWITHPALSVEAPLVLGFRISGLLPKQWVVLTVSSQNI